MTVPRILLTEPVGDPGRPLLVLGHALGASPVIWEDAVGALTADFRVSLLTIPGHSDAPVPTEPFELSELAHAVADAVRPMRGAEPAFYAGVSIGGAIALELALQHDDVFSAVASIASGAELGGRDHWTERAALVRAEGTQVLLDGLRQRWFAPGRIDQDRPLVDRILQVVAQTSDEGYARCAEALGGYDVRADLHRISIPVLAVWGEYDSVGTEAHQDTIVSAVPRSEKVKIPGVSHQVSAEDPQGTARALQRFFAAAG